MASSDNQPTGDFNVFVGNLAFRTTEVELTEHFSAAGPVRSCKIIMRGTRSLGYGFVEYSSLAEAEKAVTLLNKKEIDGRTLNVEVARPRSEKPPRPPREPRAPAAAPAEGGASAAAAEGGDAPARKPRRRPRRKVGGGAEGGAAAPAAGAAAAAGGAAPAGERRARPPARKAVDRPPSIDTVRISNLPFSVDDAQLATIFAGHKFVEAHVANKVNGRSKGYAFVRFATEAEQKAALALDGTQVGERKISVTIAPQKLAPAAAGGAREGEDE